LFQGNARRGDAPQKLRVMFKSIVEPVIVGLEADDDARRPSMPRDDDFFVGRET
jgi:hypothetical protein